MANYIHRSAGIACAAFFLVVSEAPLAQEDPWEGFNRGSYGFTDWVDRHLLKPVALGYRWLLPDPVEQGVSNVFSNLGEVVTIANEVLQADFPEAAQSTGRVLINSTIGIGGILEVADSMGLEKREPEDFGQTLAVWGVPSGPYLYVPLLGPSSVRDAPGRLVDYFFNPVNYIEDNETRQIVRGVDLVQARAELLDTEQLLSGDRYLFIRDAYQQRREFLINDGEISDDFGDDFDTDF